MKELSLNILDIAENSVKAGAKNVTLALTETGDTFEFSVSDDGCGMDKEMLARVTDPFCTSRTTRKVGLGIPLLKLAAEQTGGYMQITSRSEKEYPDSHGTVTKAFFHKNHIDFTPLGDIVSSVCTLVQGSPDMDFEFTHSLPDGRTVSLSTKEMREALGDVPLDNPEIVIWMREYLTEQYNQSGQS